MQNERIRILTMLEEGKISAEEALKLIQAIEQSDKPESHTYENREEPYNQQKIEDKESKRHSADDFMEDLKQEFTSVSERFMHFMQSTVQKVKEFDLEKPFGKTISFLHTETLPASEIKEVSIDIDHGKITIERCEEDTATADFHVKTLNPNDSEEEAKQNFMKKLVFVNDQGKLRIISDLKMMQVNVELRIPAKEYDSLTAKLLNGSFKMKDINAGKLRVKTGNGKIELSAAKFNKAEFDTANGSIHVNDVTGSSVEAETLNGRIYINGDLEEVEAHSLNGHVVITTTNPAAKKVEAKSMSGAIEIYVPAEASASGEICSAMGRLDLHLKDVERLSEQEQLFQKTVRFKKDTEGSATPIYIFGEAKAGSVLVCANASQQQ